MKLRDFWAIFSDVRTAIGIDLGGTNMRAALVGEDGTLHHILRRKTPLAEGPMAAARGMAEMIAELCALGHSPLGAGIGSPGPLSRSERKIFQTPNLPGFDGFPLGSEVEKLSGLRVLLDNDAKCATFGEGAFGVARGLKDYILLTLGTGIGGGVIADGRMIYGKSDGACEIGHMTLHPEGIRCKCGNRGCFEQYASATAIGRRADEAFGAATGARELFAAFERGDARADRVLREVALDLALGTASLVNIFDPQAIVFGGGIFTEGGGPLCGWITEMIKDRCFKSSQRGLKILSSSLAGNAGVLGAASIVFRDLAVM